MLDIVAQYIIMILGPMAVWVVGWKNKYRRWGYLIGLAAQPFWFITLAYNHQWPVFAAALVYTFAWLIGTWNFWIKRRPS